MEQLAQKYNNFIIQDKYKIKEFLGEGGFGAVFRGEHLIFGEKIRDVAIKIIKKPIAAGKEREIFSEAILQIKLEAELFDISVREKMVRVLDFGIIDNVDRHGFIIMELIKGSDLQKELKSFNNKMPENITCKYIKSICEGLGALHKLDPPLLHSDIKPDNILLTQDKKIKIADFGLAVRINKLYNWATGVSGALTFMAPETLTGISFTQSDVFSLGTMWYFMLTGNLPFDDMFPPSDLQDEKAAMWRYKRRQTIKPPSPQLVNNTCSERISNIILKCLEFEHTKRYKDANDVLAAINSETLSRDDYLRIIAESVQKKEYSQAVDLANKALKLPKAYNDKTDFLLRKLLAFAYLKLQNSQYFDEAAQLFEELRNENKKLKWLPQQEFVELLKDELELNKLQNNHSRIILVKALINSIK